MFLTLSENQRVTLATHPVRAWGAVELEFDGPVLMCTWSGKLSTRAVRGTALLLFEPDLREWIGPPGIGRCLRHLQLLEPSIFGWILSDIRAVWDEPSEELQTNVLVLEDVKGGRHTLWSNFTAPEPASDPVWTCQVPYPVQEAGIQKADLGDQALPATRPRSQGKS